MTVTVLDKASPVPRYLQVADSLRRRIAQGEWAGGQPLPSLPELARSFGVARLTARQAVQLLAAEGLLSTGRGRQTVVASAPVPVRTSPLETSLREIAETYRGLTPHMLAFAEEPRSLPAAAGLPPDPTGYVHMRRLHTREDLPYCVIDLYLAAPVYALAPERFRTQAVIPILLECPQALIAHARQTLTIGSADTATATLLRLESGAPVVHVARVFQRTDDSVLYYAEVVYRGDAIRLDIDLRT